MDQHHDAGDGTTDLASEEVADSAKAFCTQQRLDQLVVALGAEPFAEQPRAELVAFLDGGYREGQQAWVRLGRSPR